MTIKPHGSDILRPLYVADAARRAALEREAATLPSLLLNSAAAANAVMLGAGYFSPLPGYMNLADTLSVARDLRTTSGLFWPVPIVNLTQDASAIEGARRIALRDPNVAGNPVLAVMDVMAVETVSKEQLEAIAQQVFGTLDPKHPGTGTFLTLGNTLVSGPIEVLGYSYFADEFPGTFRTAVQIRDEIAQRGWKKVVAFQTRNPMHRAHEELCRMAKERLGADGIVIHMLLGKLKEGDIPADVRDACIRQMVEKYFEPNTVLITGYGFDMLYAGPREAVLHAVFRQNMGATHLIVGRDHAGVGSYYGPFDAHHIFDQIPRDALETRPLKIDWTFWCYKCGGMASGRTCPHGDADRLLVSGTQLRKWLSEGSPVPPEYSRPEVLEVLRAYYADSVVGTT